jgi:hypothetical protein
VPLTGYTATANYLTLMGHNRFKPSEVGRSFRNANRLTVVGLPISLTAKTLSSRS